MLFDDELIERIADMIMEIQGKENTILPMLRKQYADLQRGIDNLLNAIQQGIITPSTKQRLEDLENQKSDVSVQIIKEEMAKPELTKDQILFWFNRLRKYNTRRLDHRRRLIDLFINTIYLYDDKMVITFNYKDDSKVISLNDVEKSDLSSDLTASALPEKSIDFVGAFFILNRKLNVKNKQAMRKCLITKENLTVKNQNNIMVLLKNLCHLRRFAMKIEIDYSKKYQTFEGMGASGAWWAQLVGGWDDEDKESNLQVRDRISELLYSKTKGIGLRTYRYNIGGGSAESGRGEFSDPARRAECFDDGKGGLDFTKDANAVYMMRMAALDGADEIILFVNSPVERLTKNGKAHLDKHKIFRTNLLRKNYEAFADYVLDVTEYFVKEGLPVRYISPINEPMWIWNGGQEGCHYSPRQTGEVMLCFAKKLALRKSLSEVRLSGVENGDIRWFNKSYTRNLLKHEEVRAFIDSVDLHSYCLPQKFMPHFANDRVGFVKRFRKWMDKKYPDIPVKMSEWCHMQGGKNVGMDSALETAKVMYEDIGLLNVTSWQHWIACSIYDYCDGLIYLDAENHSYELTKRYYVTGNFSKYIPYKAVRVEAKTDDEDVKALSFLKDGKTYVVLVNFSSEAKKIIAEKNSLVAVTDENKNLEEYTVKENEEICVTPKSVTTIIEG